MPLSESRKRIVGFLLSVIGLVGLYTVLYSWGMRRFENRPRSIIESLGVIVETMTTTGYGTDAPWSSVEMQIFIIIVQISGIALLFLIIELFAKDVVLELLQPSPNTSVSKDYSNHVIVCGTNEPFSYILDELTAMEKSYIVIAEDSEEAIDLDNNDINVLYGDPSSEDVLEECNVSNSNSVICLSEDNHNTNIILGVRHISDDTEIIAVANDSKMLSNYKHAGADLTISPHRESGRALAEKTKFVLDLSIDLGFSLTDKLELYEIPVQPGSRLEGQKVKSSDISEKDGVNILGIWDQGDFHSPPNVEDRITSNTVLVVVKESDVDLSDYVLRSAGGNSRNVVIAGAGDGGSAAAEELESSETEISYTTIDNNEELCPDIVGDAADEGILKEAGIEKADAYIVCLEDDDTAITSTLISREMNNNVGIMVGTEHMESAKRAQQAGADYVLTKPQLAGRRIVSAIKGSTVADSNTTRIRVTEVRCTTSLHGETPKSSDIRANTGSTVIALYRDSDDSAITVSPDTELRQDDRLIIAGTDNSVRKFISTYDGEEV